MKDAIRNDILKSNFPLRTAIVFALIGALLATLITVMSGLDLVWCFMISAVVEILSAIIGVRISWIIQEKFDKDNDDE